MEAKAKNCDGESRGLLISVSNLLKPRRSLTSHSCNVSMLNSPWSGVEQSYNESFEYRTENVAGNKGGGAGQVPPN